jgi:DNA-binding MarR family transcriptional regulator
MSKDVLDEREFELINILGKGLASNQREISQHMNMSLGMVNMLLRRLISKGLIRIEQLNQKKVQYLLTPKGFAEKMQKSVKYTMNTIRSITLIREQLKTIVLSLKEKGHNDFFVLGDSDLTMLLTDMFNNHFGSEYKLEQIKEIPEELNGKYLLICKEGYEGKKKSQENVLNVLEEIANIGMFNIKDI